MEKELLRRNHRGETVEEAWMKYQGGNEKGETWERIMEEELWRHCAAETIRKGL